MTESSFYNRITRYYEREGVSSLAWESKFTRTGRIPFHALAPHQEQNLLRATAAFGHKIADSGVAQKPFDGFVLRNADAVVVCIFYEPKKTEVYEIPIRKWIVESYTSGAKSLTKARARAIGTRIEI